MHELLHLWVPIKGTSASFSVSVTCAGREKEAKGETRSAGSQRGRAGQLAGGVRRWESWGYFMGLNMARLWSWGAELLEQGWDEGRKGHSQDDEQHGRGWTGPAGSKGKGFSQC